MSLFYIFIRAALLRYGCYAMLIKYPVLCDCWRIGAIRDSLRTVNTSRRWIIHPVSAIALVGTLVGRLPCS